MKNDTLLYLDDEFLNLKVLEVQLQGIVPVIIEERAERALQILDENPQIKWVISDWRMPVMDGLEFVKRAKLKHPDLDYYLLSGFFKNQEIINELEQNTILRYFEKPIEISELIKHLNIDESN